MNRNFPETRASPSIRWRIDIYRGASRPPNLASSVHSSRETLDVVATLRRDRIIVNPRVVSGRSRQPFNLFASRKLTDGSIAILESSLNAINKATERLMDGTLARVSRTIFIGVGHSRSELLINSLSPWRWNGACLAIAH